MLNTLLLRFMRVTFLISVAVSVSGAVIGEDDGLDIRSPATFFDLSALPSPIGLTTTDPTDFGTIANTAYRVNQKTGPTDSAPPSNNIPPTVVTAIDGNITEAGQSGTSLLKVLHNPDSHPNLDTGSIVYGLTVSLQQRGNYTQIFEGTGTNASDRDASIQGTAYLTFTRLDSYDVSTCKAFCDGIEACVFVNLFYEYNSDATYNPQVKCAAYGDVHTASEKTNFGGQQLLPPPIGTSYIQQSVGYASDSLVEPPVPEGYELVFGPVDGANQAVGYGGFTFIDKYDVQACANLCNARGFDSVGGVCQYFNIWRAVVDGNPTTYTCSMYWFPTDASTATNTGQGNLQVTYSRGYQRISYLPNGNFEDFHPCPINPNTSYECATFSSSPWVATSPPGGFQDAAIIDYPPEAILGHTFVLLGSAPNYDTLPGTITTSPLNTTIPGESYILQFYQASLGPLSFLDVFWNGHKVYSVQQAPIGYYHPYQVAVTATGNDVLSFTGGMAPSSRDVLDYICLFLA